MTGVRFADAGRLRIPRSSCLSLEEFEDPVAPFEAAFQGRRRASMGNPKPAFASTFIGGPAVDAGEWAGFPAHLPEDLCCSVVQGRLFGMSQSKAHQLS